MSQLSLKERVKELAELASTRDGRREEEPEAQSLWPPTFHLESANDKSSFGRKCGNAWSGPEHTTQAGSERERESKTSAW